MAADSRNHRTQREVTDDMCKIFTFGNKVAVALGGVSGHTSRSDPAKNWDGFKQLGLAYVRQSGSTRDFAEEWSAEMRAIILRDVLDDPIRFTNAIASWDGSRGGVLSGIFVGSDDLQGFAVRLTLVKVSNGYDVLTDYLRHAPRDCDFVCGAVGTEIIDEIKAGLTTRARLWHNAFTKMSPSERAIEAVRLTIKHYPKQEDVGGRIDAVLVSHNGIHWIKRQVELQRTAVGGQQRRRIFAPGAIP